MLKPVFKFPISEDDSVSELQVEMAKLKRRRLKKNQLFSGV
jgi:hypothetical protein